MEVWRLGKVNGARSGRKKLERQHSNHNKLDEVEVVQTQVNEVETRSDLRVGCSVPIFVLYSDKQQPATVPQSHMYF